MFTTAANQATSLITADYGNDMSRTTLCFQTTSLFLFEDINLF